MPDTSINERFRIIVDRFEKGKQAAFARKINVRTGTVGDILGARQTKPGFEILAKVVKAYPEMSADWLLSGKGEFLKADEPTQQPIKIVFDRKSVDERLLKEVRRLRAEGEFATYTELSNRLGVHHSLFSEIESGRYHCTVKLLFLLDAHFGIDIHYIVNG